MAEPMVITTRNFDLKRSNLKMAEKSRVIILELLVFFYYIYPESTVHGFLYMMKLPTALTAVFYSAFLFLITQEQHGRISISKWFRKM